METTGFMQTAGIAIAQGIPFSVYGEALIITGQNFIIILLLWSYNKSISFAEKALVTLFLGGYAFLLFSPGMLEANHWQVVASSTTLLGFGSKVP